MYRVTVNKNRFFFIAALAGAVAAAIYFPPLYPDNLVEIPTAALFAGEAGLSLLLALLFYENANTSQAIRLSGSILGFIMILGAVSNYVCQATQMLPESFVLVSWVQLISMNVGGALTTLCLFRLEAEDQYKFVIQPPEKAPAAPGPQESETKPQGIENLDFSPPEGMATGEKPAGRMPPNREFKGTGSMESVQDILGKLDVSRIEKLEQSLTKEKVSLEALFSQESQAAAMIGQSEIPSASSSSVQSAPAVPDSISYTERPTTELPSMKQIGRDPDVPTNTSGQSLSEKGYVFDQNINKELDNLFADVVEPESEKSESFRPSIYNADPTKTLQLSQADVDAVMSGMSTTTQHRLQGRHGIKVMEPRELAAFGRLSQSSAEPIVLDEASVGTMKTIGKMLLDIQAVEQLLEVAKEGGSGCRIITEEQGQGILALLAKVDDFPGVQGGIIIGHDGLIICTTLPEDFDQNIVGPLSFAIYSTSDMSTEAIDIGRLHQAILKCGDNLTIVTDIGVGILAIVCKDIPSNQFDKLLDVIHTTIYGKSASD
jgi:predicted regulator of Ras-like GTPase activity (Roadblock/LC7/MglB family)